MNYGMTLAYTVQYSTWKVHNFIVLYLFTSSKVKIILTVLETSACQLCRLQDMIFKGQSER